MKTTTQKAAEALDLLPEEMREPAVAYLIEQAEKFRALKEQIEEGIRTSLPGGFPSGISQSFFVKLVLQKLSKRRECVSAFPIRRNSI